MSLGLEQVPRLARKSILLLDNARPYNAEMTRTKRQDLSSATSILLRCSSHFPLLSQFEQLLDKKTFQFR